jgi:hypothetical protein
LQAVVGEDALDAALADREVGLAQFLGDDGGAGVRIQVAIAQDLADDGVSAARGGFGAGFVGEERGDATLEIGGVELVITLAAAAIFGGDGGDGLGEALALQEHEETLGLGIVSGDRQGARGSADELADGIERECGVHGDKVREAGQNVQ